MNVVVSRALLAAVCLTLVGSTVGCGKAKQPWDTAYPTAGNIKFGGKPLAGAQITLIPADKEIPDTVRPRGYTDETGGFELSTYGEADGAPEGKYKVIAMRYPVIGSKENPAQGPNDLPPKYSNADTSDLIVEITKDDNELSDLELK